MAVSSRSPRRPQSGFSLIDVMMGSLVLVVGLMGMIQAVLAGAEMLSTARKQTLAAQIIQHEIDELRVASWTTISGLATAETAITIDDTQFGTAITAEGLIKESTASNITLSYPTRTLVLTRTVSDVVANNLRQVTFTVKWAKGGTSASASSPGGSWFNQLSFQRADPIRRDYTRSMTSYYGRNGLNQSFLRQ
jgi:Tfp pilus assembly protein PilV